MIRLVMAREIRQRLRSKGFAITTALLCLAIIGVGGLHRALSGDDGPTRYDVAVVGDIPADFDDALGAAADALGIEVRVESVADRNAAVQQLRDDDADVVVDAAGGELLSNEQPADRLAAAVNGAWQRVAAEQAAADAGLSEEQAEAILTPRALSTALIEPGGDDDDDVGMIVGTAAAVMLFISINAFGGMVLTGVVEEKSTGVVEVLLSHVRAHQLLIGKVLGIGVIALIQFASAIVAGVIALRISGTSIPTEVWVGLPSTVAWFLFGFVLYSTLFALAGSFVSRQEDAQGAAAPISTVFTAAYLTVFVLGAEPDATATRVLSVLPPFAPLLMPLRIATGSASVVEILIAAVLLVGATVGMFRLAGAVYARTLLHRGARLGWRDALRLSKS